MAIIYIEGLLTVGMAVAILATTAALAPAITPSVLHILQKTKSHHFQIFEDLLIKFLAMTKIMHACVIF